MFVIQVVSAVCFIFLLRIAIVFWQIFENRRNKRTSSKKKVRKECVKTVVVLGSGGHTTEMMRLLSPHNLSPQFFSPLIYIIASTDTTSEAHLQVFKEHRQPDITIKIPRSREVGQPYLTSIVTTLYALIYSFYIVLFQIRPSLILCNGPGTCLPIAISALVGRILGICEGQVIFIESFCRVQRYVPVRSYVYAFHHSVHFSFYYYERKHTQINLFD